MMIGGDDVVIPTRLKPELSLGASVRVLLRRWPGAVVQDARTGRVYPDYGSVAFRDLGELMVYQDKEAFDSWERLGAEDENAGTMVHLLAGPGELTVVVGDRSTSDAKGLIDAIRHVLHYLHTSGQQVGRRAA